MLTATNVLAILCKNLSVEWYNDLPAWRMQRTVSNRQLTCFTCQPCSESTPVRGGIFG